MQIHSLQVTPSSKELFRPHSDHFMKVTVTRDVVDQVEGFPLHMILVRRTGLPLVLHFQQTLQLFLLL